MRPPAGLLIISLAFLLLGAAHFLFMLLDWAHGILSIAFGVLMCPVAWGLWHRRRSSLFWAKFWIWFHFVGVGFIMVVLPFTDRASFRIPYFYEAKIHDSFHAIAVVCIPLLLMTFAAMRYLRSPAAVAWFSHPQRQEATKAVEPTGSATIRR